MHSADSCSLPDRRGPASWLFDFRRGRWRRPAAGGLHLALFGHLSAGFRGRYPRTAAFSCPRMSKNCLLLAGQYKRKKPLKSVAFYLYWTSLDYELMVQNATEPTFAIRSRSQWMSCLSLFLGVCPRLGSIRVRRGSGKPPSDSATLGRANGLNAQSISSGPNAGGGTRRFEAASYAEAILSTRSSSPGSARNTSENGRPGAASGVG